MAWGSILSQPGFGGGGAVGAPNGPVSQTRSPGMLGPNGQPMIPPGPNQQMFPGSQPQPGAAPTGPGTLNVNPATVGTTPQNIMDSPAYQFRRDEGLRGVQQSAAAKGSLLTGGTLKDLQQYGQGLASTEFGNQWDRDYRLAGLNSGIAEGNAGRLQTGLSDLLHTGYGAASQMGGYANEAGQAQAGGTIGSQSAWNAGISGAANTIGGYLEARRQRQSNPQGLSA